MTVRRTPVVLTDEGHPTIFHRYIARQAEPGVKVGDVMLGERVTEETSTHTLVGTVELEPKSC